MIESSFNLLTLDWMSSTALELEGVVAVGGDRLWTTSSHFLLLCLSNPSFRP